MSAGEIDFDLDFTRCIPVPPSLRAAAAVPPATQPAPRQARRVVNLVCYARAGAARPADASDAPVLVVEDHEPSLRMMEKLLQRQGFTVRTAADSRECARALRKPPPPRLILLDVGLPRVNGFQILTHLRQHARLSAIPVVLVTGRTSDKDLMLGLSLGAEGYLSKPVSVRALQSVIDTVLCKP